MERYDQANQETKITNQETKIKDMRYTQVKQSEQQLLVVACNSGIRRGPTRPRQSYLESHQDRFESQIKNEKTLPEMR